MGKINSNGICNFCKTKSIEYGILNGSYIYYCHRCKKDITSYDILIDRMKKYFNK